MSKPTHIIVGIDNIIVKIQQLELQNLGNDPNSKEEAFISAQVSILKELLEDGKQISLDEKDIEEKALTYVNSDDQKATLKWNSGQFIDLDIKSRTKKVTKDAEEFLKKKLHLKLASHQMFAYKKALKDILL